MYSAANYLLLILISITILSCSNQQTEHYFKQTVLIVKKQDSLLNYFKSPDIQKVITLCDKTDQLIIKVQIENRDTLTKKQAEELLDLHFLSVEQKKYVKHNKIIFDKLELQRKQLNHLQEAIKEKKLNPERIEEGIRHEQNAIERFVKEIKSTDSIIQINVKKQMELQERVVTYLATH